MRQLRESKFNSVRIEKERREIIRERGARWYAFECNNGYPRIVESSDMIVPSLRVLCNKVISLCRKAVVQPLDTGTTQLCNHVSLAWQNHEHKTEPIEEGVYNKSSGLHAAAARCHIHKRRQDGKQDIRLKKYCRCSELNTVTVFPHGVFSTALWTRLSFHVAFHLDLI